MRSEDRAPAEQILWKYLRGDQLQGLRFRRQFRIDSYIVDFYCPAIRLAVELDGDSHVERAAYDERRPAVLEQHGCRVLRFTNNYVINSIDAVLGEMELTVEMLRINAPSPLPSPRVQGEGGDF